MKKLISLFLVIVMVAAFLPTAIPAVGAASYTATSGWGKGADGKYHVASPQDLVAFANVSSSLSGETVVLDNDVVFNDKTAAQMQSSSSGLYVWTAKSVFSGTFDGQGHSIKGLFNNSGSSDIGFIKELYGTVRNVYFVDVYFSGDQCVGAVSSRAGGGSRYENVYVDGIVKGTYHVGGIAGSELSGSTTFVSCWFNGDVSASSSYVSGILGNQQSQTATFTDCLNTGSVSCPSNNKAGISNAVYGGYITATRCVNAGDVTGGGYSGSAIAVTVGNAGWSKETTLSHCSFADCYGVKGLSSKVVPIDLRYNNLYNQTYEGSGISEIASFAALTGASALSGKWDLKYVGGSYAPVPKYFADAPVIEISTYDQLKAWAANASSFSGKTFVLTADIVANSGTAAEHEASGAANVWTAKSVFSGTFDGRGHSVKGLFNNGGNDDTGFIKELYGTVRNVYFTDVYFSGSDCVGAVSSRAGGGSRYENVYVDGIVKGTYHVGGIAGSELSGSTTFVSCWFNGDVSASSSYVSGILGNQQSQTATFTDCLNTGSVSCPSNNKAGISNAVYGGYITATRCVNAGDVTGGGYSGSAIAVTVGNAGWSKETTLSHCSFADCYGVKGLSSKIVPIDLRYNNLYNQTYEGSGIGEIASLSDLAENAAFAEGWELKYVGGRFVPVPKYFADAPVLRIGTYAELAAWASNSLTYSGQTVVLTADIVANAGTAAQHASSGASNVWPVKTTFNGNFDGQGHTISGLYINSGSDKGFIKNLYGTVRNVRFSETYFSGSTRVGGVAAFAYDGALFENVYVDGIIKTSGANCAGIAAGILGSNASDTVTFRGCWSAAELSASEYVSGILANQESKTAIFTDCLNTGKITSNSDNKAGISNAVYGGYITATRCVNAGNIVKTDGTKTTGRPIAVTIGQYSFTDLAEVKAHCSFTDCYAVWGSTGNIFPNDIRYGGSIHSSDAETVGTGIKWLNTSISQILDEHSSEFASTWGWYKEGSTVYAVPKYFSNYMATSSSAPVKPGMKFAGWYGDPLFTNGTALPTRPTNAYAKFVSGDLLNVRAQATTEPDADGTYRIRFVSTIDECTDYANVGFVITANGKEWTLTLKKVYLYVLENGVRRSAGDVSGCGDAAYISFAVLKGIPADTKNASITAKPFWTTADGTRVYGDMKTYVFNASAAAKLSVVS